ncbi:MAG: hypothetical protein ABF630_10350 [Liquorilactobacillus sp.]|uniref:hypothetical protein n=1 Tax=Liquorilactobacillus nagelii TaxID=82688 RepID=UPI0039EC904B
MNKRIDSTFTIQVDGRKNSKTLCLILAGYKPFLWENTLERVRKFVPSNYDVCLVSSGVYSEELKNKAEKNKWTYLTVEKNNVSIAQNIAISNFPQAKEIFKIDEDIFVTKNFFETMIETYTNAEKNSYYCPGVIAPLITINGVGYVKILSKLGLDKEYRKRFEDVRFASNDNKKIENDVAAAKFMWGVTGHVPQLDKINASFQREDLRFFPSPVRFSIGAIYFKRQIWQDMGMFKIGSENGLGADELNINKYCYCKSRPILISMNSVVGHLSFRNQNIEMEEFYKTNSIFFE